ncbi:hypothetical protein EYF80_028572 [Liparis tanakae]|uniref:Uncharacterized protein n=1 Tax=Liparis tanakae TaxID=230148 RepID=A0A4Z2H5M7_9TELE|nr:hypothetical protein EYF80_028572 [Liparis tanakae]
MERWESQGRCENGGRNRWRKGGRGRNTERGVKHTQQQSNKQTGRDAATNKHRAAAGGAASVIAGYHFIDRKRIVHREPTCRCLTVKTTGSDRYTLLLSLLMDAVMTGELTMTE